jgi:dsDNA-specific endonuclease/ATPase MutS2
MGEPMESDPFDEPVILEIKDSIDLHTIPPKQVKAVVEEYLIEARKRAYPIVRIIHGKGIGVQREIVRTVLDRTPFVTHYTVGPGATVAYLDSPEVGADIAGRLE